MLEMICRISVFGRFFFLFFFFYLLSPFYLSSHPWMSNTKLFFFLSYCLTAPPRPPLCQAQQPAESIRTHCWTFFLWLLCTVLQKASAFALAFWWFVRCNCAAVVRLAEKKERNAWTRIRLDWQGDWGILRLHFFSLFFCAFSLRDMHPWDRRHRFEMLSGFFFCLGLKLFGGVVIRGRQIFGYSTIWLRRDDGVWLGPLKWGLSSSLVYLVYFSPSRCHSLPGLTEFGWGCAIVSQRERTWLWCGWDRIPGSGDAD